MANKKENNKQLQDKLQIILADLLKDDDNKYCVDCDSKGPRWASWTLGIFLCIRCAGIHRNLGVHLSRVKSVNLDSWTPQQVAMMKEIGNSRGRAIYEANLEDNFRRPQTDSSLEQFVRAKYEHKKYIAKEWVPPNPSVDIIAEEIRKIDQIQNKKRLNYNPTNSVSNVTAPINATNININRRENNEVTEDISQNTSNKIDLLGLDSDNVATAAPPTNSIDDAFGDFVFAATQSPVVSNQGQSGGVVVSSAVDDLMGLNLGSPNFGVVTSSCTSGVGFGSDLGTVPIGVVTVPAGPGGGKLDKSSILALYSTNAAGGTGQNQSNSAGWPNTALGLGGAVSATYQYQQQQQQHQQQYQATGSLGVVNTDYQQQQQRYGSANSWLGSGQLGSNANSFGTQHNPFFNNATFAGPTAAMTISKPAFPTNVASVHSSQSPNQMLW